MLFAFSMSGFSQGLNPSRSLLQTSHYFLKTSPMFGLKKAIFGRFQVEVLKNQVMLFENHYLICPPKDLFLLFFNRSFKYAQ